MDIILWRHADAGPPTNGGDLDRPLTEHGHDQARKMAKWLDAHLPDRVRVFASPAVRTQETVKHLTKEYKTTDTILPNATPTAVLATIGWPNAQSMALVVGHQPWLGKTISLLMCKTAMDWNIKKGSIWWLTVKDGENVIRAVVRPKDILVD